MQPALTSINFFNPQSNVCLHIAILSLSANSLRDVFEINIYLFIPIKNA